MFLASSAKPIDASLQSWVDKLEKTSPGLSVVAARQLRYCLYQTPVELKVTAPRKFNVLEEMILRASLEIDPAPTQEELAVVLGLDPIFVRSTAANLQALNTLKVVPGLPLQLTPEGRNFYQKGVVPQPPTAKLVYAIADPVLATVAIEPDPLPESHFDLPDLADFLPLTERILAVESLILEEIQQLVRDRGLGFHLPESGNQVTAFQAGEPPQPIWQSIGLFAIFDAIDERLTLQFRRGNQLLEPATLWLENLPPESTVSLSQLLQISADGMPVSGKAILESNPEVEARLETIRQIAAQNLQPSGKNSPPGSVMLLQDNQIRQQFLASLEDADRCILMLSPAITTQTIDDRFVQVLETLVKRGVWILWGYGISAEDSPETSPIPPEVLAKLSAIKTAEGLSAVQSLGLGNSPAKEVAIDSQVYFCGDRNWLSYRGDRFSTGETVYRVTLPECVRSAHDSLASRFQQQARALWENAVSDRNSDLAVISLCAWGALAMETTALQQIEAQQWWELFPVWLQIVCQGLRSQQLSPDSPCFPQALALLCEMKASEDKNLTLREALRQVMVAIASQDRDRAVHLLSESVWQEFTRLGIAEATLSPDAFISTELAKLSQNLPKNKNALSKTRKRH